MKILLIYPDFSSFVRNDYFILKKYGKIKKFRYRQGKSFSRHLWSQIQLCYWLIFNIWSSDKIFCWFADYHSLLPAFFSKIFKKEFFVVLGGYDVVHIPEIGYGSLKNPIRKFCALFTIKNAKVNLAVSEYIRRTASHLIPNSRIEVVFNGVNTDLFPHQIAPKDNLIITVGAGNSFQRIKLKGIDIFCEVAKRLPEFRFLIIGVGVEAKKYLGEIPQNLEIRGWVKYDELIHHYQRAKIYCQFSMIESFGMALVEAMLCECIPVVFKTGALPEIVGQTGIVTERGINEAAEAIKKAFKLDPSIRKKARERILNNFTLNHREHRLKEILNLNS